MHEDYFNLEIAVAVVVVVCAQSLGSKRQQPRREGQAELGDLGPRSLHCNVNSCLLLDVSENPLGCHLNFLHILIQPSLIQS